MKLRSAFVLPTTILACAIATIVMLAFTGRSTHSSRTSEWNRDHLALRLLTESIAEELFAMLQINANQPYDPTYLALRSSLVGPAFRPTPLGWLQPDVTLSELSTFEQRTGGRVTLLPPEPGHAHVEIVAANPISSDPVEQSGRIAIHIAIRYAGRHVTLVEQVRLERTYVVSRVAVPPMPDPLGGFSVLISQTEGTLQPNLVSPGGKSGPPAVVHAGAGSCTRADGSYRTLMEMMSQPPPDGFASVRRSQIAKVSRVTNTFAPSELAARAQFVTSSASVVTAFVASRLRSRPPLPFNGIIYLSSTEPLRLEFGAAGGLPPFLGTAMIASAGPITVGDVAMEDIRRDSLTIVSASRILVTGRSVDAALVAAGPTGAGVVFTRTARVLGPLISNRFPRGLRLSGHELGQVQVGVNASLPCVKEQTEAPLNPAHSGTIALFSPNPTRLEHELP
jgi:hypothetical protein